MSDRRRTRSQGPGPPTPLTMANTRGSLPYCRQIARDQAEAIRLASEVSKGDRLTTSSTSTHNSTESSEIPPENIEQRVGQGDPHENGEILPDTKDSNRGIAQEDGTNWIPPVQHQENDGWGATEE